jgi:hypothetical protein
MDKNTRNAIERATQDMRKLLEEDFAAQLEGDFDVRRGGDVAAKSGSHLTPRQAFQRDRIVAAIEHKRTAGMSAADAVADYLRDAAFTTLNRFAALKMLEARELVQECVTRGDQSGGYREFCGMAPGLPLLPNSAGYRLYIECLFDELSTEVKVLFDRRDSSSVLWPKRVTFEELLEILNGRELAGVWGEDETIGWVYQYFNGQVERRRMREESQAPRNSRELAVRNQFFTPRYVVQFLADNTLGCIWYEMRGTHTQLAERCEYMVRKPSERFAPRPKKDPRDLRVLDPACGSGHFLLYAFELLLTIYEEGYTDRESPKSEATGRALVEDFATLADLRRAAPALILAHNLHGVDIDPRCAQIAQLALWMRAQRAYRESGITRSERPMIRRSKIVIAEPLVADDQIAKEFVSRLGDAELGRVFTALVDALKLAGDLGFLLRIETLVARPTKRGQTGDLFAPPEERIRAAIARFVSDEGSRSSARKRLFADDAAQGAGFLSIAETKFDVVLMNPPFGRASIPGKGYVDEEYERAKADIYAAFVERAVELMHDSGRLGAITSRLGLFSAFLERWRTDVMFGRSGVAAIADLGHGVLDDALVEAAAYVIEISPTYSDDFWAAGLLDSNTKDESLRAAVASAELRRWHKRSRLSALPGSPVAYWVPDSFLETVFAHRPMAESTAEARWGLQTDDNFRFVRLSWEVPVDGLGNGWTPLAKGGEYALFYDDIHLVVNWSREARELKASIEARYSWTKNARSAEWYGRPGLTYPERTTSELSLRALPQGCVFNIAGPAIFVDHIKTRHALLALSYTRLFRTVLEVLVGGGDAVESGSAARHYKAGALNRVPIPMLASIYGERLALAGAQSLSMMFRLAHLDETSRVFSGVPVGRSFAAFVSARVADYQQVLVSLEEQSDISDDAAMDLYGLDDDARGFVEETYGPHTAKGIAYPTPAEVSSLLELPVDELVDRASSKLGFRRQTTKAAYFTDRRYELIALLLNTSVAQVVEAARNASVIPTSDRRTLAIDALSYLFGIAVGRWGAQVREPSDSPFAALPARAPAMDAVSAHAHLVVDDPGAISDIEVVIAGACVAIGWDSDEAFAAAAVADADLRGYFARRFFSDHVARYSRSRRAAPIYWQLATPSASYSVWLYIHAFTKDTIFRVQNDYLTPKLAHEERRLEAMTSEFRQNTTADQRKGLAAQGKLVEELRAFLEEVKRIAPLWKPNLDDGVIINFAPLWRLVPQNKSWQKELKATWDKLCDGTFDWAHLAMHLWPERVVPKCVSDRSLAIAHGLDEVFWVEGIDGKWSARRTPTRPVEELVRVRTSPAVKAALKSLLEAPTATGDGGSARGRRRSTAVAEGGEA